MTVRRIKIVSLLLILAILVTSFSAISVAQAKTVSSVRNVKAVEADNVSFCMINWEKVRGADGYRIFLFNTEKNSFEVVKTVKNGKARQTKIDNLASPGEFRFKVQAYKDFRGKTYYSDMSAEVSTYTCPGKLTANAVSASEGALTVSWQLLPGVSGYELQFVKGESFDSADVATQIFNSGTAVTYTASPLEVGAVYSARVRAMFSVSKGNKTPKTVYGEWSDTVAATIADKTIPGAGIDKDKPMVALTFDDGPAYNGSTGRILDVLEKYGARATFFMVGERINGQTKKYLEREVQLGCELGNHTYDHSHYGSAVTVKDVSKCSKAIYDAVGQNPTAFRCPGGRMSGVMQKEAKAENMVIGYWSVDTEDWKSKNKGKIVKKIKGNVYDGSIVLMHDIYTSTADAVEVIVPYLIEQGYQLVTVSELIQAKTGQPAQAGQQYVDYKTINNKTQ